MTDALLKIESVRGKVDFAVITIRTDEYQAVLDRLPGRKSLLGGQWLYEYASLRNKYGEQIRVAVARTQGQGHGAAQQTANDMVVDLNPKWIVLVGIAGGFPNDDFSLGDVVLASRVVDLSVTAANRGGGTEYAVHGGPCHPNVESLLSWLPSQKRTLCEWCGPKKLIQSKPTLTVPNDGSDDRLYGDEEHKKKVSKSLRMHFSTVREPLFAPVPLGTSNTLVKDTEILRQFTDVSRDIEHVEMEAGGVYRVCHGKNLPLLCVRGISDIVGFKRGPEWTLFACHSAASFFDAILTTLPRQAWGESLDNLNSWATGLKFPAILPSSLAKTVRLAVSTSATLGAGFWSGCVYVAGIIARTNLPSVNNLKKRIGKHSDWLLRFQLPDEERIDFAVESDVCEISDKHKVTLLLGRPGSGKTCLLAKVGHEFLKNGFPVLAIKADMFPHDKSFDEWAKEEIGYDLTFLDVVQALAAHEKIIVLVDQLDALASTVDLTSSRLNQIISFIANCNELPNAYVISSCRDFDFSYDPRFRRLEAKTYQLEPPSWEQTADLLKSHRINPDLIPPKLRDVLRTPQHLAIFLKLQVAESTNGGQRG